ncbi:MAG: triose-phosphate isomerase [Candidatus Sungbacteria bacterium]|nr:triose-phosphate isomerase [bacterium]MDZ4260142.1 triose-phosphate isomerase [Candidatus Sungbacteria bacterium]
MKIKPLIIANWKMNPDAPGRAVLLANKIERLISRTRNVEVVIAPPFPFLLPIAAVLKRAKLGVQNVFWEDTGAYTGEVSSHQLKHLRVEYAIVGHSERRIFLGETDEMIHKKVVALLASGIVPILCVGERERVENHIPEVVGMQIEAALVGVKKGFMKKLVIAYEPIWAISTMPHAKPDTPEQAFRAMVYIRNVVTRLYGRTTSEDIKIIYGGSVKAKNIEGFLRDGHMQGALVGGASLDPNEFSEIVKIASLL